MTHDSAILSAGAVALSNPAAFASQMQHLRRNGAVGEEAERELIERHLRPDGQ